jgi:uncharacterized membrane protein YedE/YeeE
MENFTPLSAYLGGALIGISATLFLYFNGRITGISGIMHGVFSPPKNEITWRVLFLAGIMVGACLYNTINPGFFIPRQGYPMYLLITGGFLVGFGTRLGSGCTSGHGICGIARLAPRSILATVTFMLTGMLTVYMIRHALELSV